MKKTVFFSVIIILFYVLVGCNQKDDHVKKWQEDLDYMKGYLEIVHPELYAYVTEEEFDKHFDYIKDNCKTLDDVEIVTRIVEIFALIQDGHTDVAYDYLDNKYIAGLFHKYPIFLYKFSDGLYVLWAKNEYSEIVGKRLLKIGNLKADEALKQMTRLNAGDNEMGKIQYLPVIQEFLQYTGVIDKSTMLLNLVYEDKNGNELSFELDNPESALESYWPPKFFGLKDSVVTTMNDNCNHPLPLYLSHIDKADGNIGEYYWYEYIQEHETIYLNISLNINKDDDPFDAFCKRMFNDLDSLKAKKLIVDVRLNGGGSHFEMPLIKGIIERPDIDTEGNLFLIIGRRTISASEHVTTQMEKYTNVTIFGEPTSGRPNMVGSNTFFYLPNSKLKCRTAKEYTQDSEFFDSRLMTKPDIYALLSSDDFKNNLDPVLSAIFVYDSTFKVINELRLLMQQAYTKNGIEGLKNAFYQNKNECDRLGVNFEKFLVYDLWKEKSIWDWVYVNMKEDVDELELLKFIAEELPNSVFANYFYARCLYLNDNYEEAKNYYQKCLKLNPAHSNAIKDYNLLKFHENYEVMNYGGQ